MATCSLHNLLNASLLSESGPPLLDFEVRVVILLLCRMKLCGFKFFMFYGMFDIVLDFFFQLIINLVTLFLFRGYLQNIGLHAFLSNFSIKNMK